MGRAEFAGRSNEAFTSTAMMGPSPISAIALTGRLSTSEPSMYSSRPRTWGGAMIGRQMLKPTASQSGPWRAMTNRPLRNSVLPDTKLRGSSSISRVPNVRCSIERNRSPRISECRGSV